MSNNGRITLCPFYRDEKNNSISCEDFSHTFAEKYLKKKHMDRYCDADWHSCPYAVNILSTYDEGGKMDKAKKNAIENIELKKELHKLKILLGQSRKREKEKSDELEHLKLENTKIEAYLFKERDKSKELIEKGRRAVEELEDITRIYEARFAYLISEYAGGTMNEELFNDWCQKTEYAITADNIEETEDGNRVKTWKVHTREI